MKLIVVSALFTAALSLFATSSMSRSGEDAKIDVTAQAADDQQVQATSECAAAGGICRKSACRVGEVSAPLDCGHDLGCCLPTR